MNKKLLTLAIGAALAAPMLAQADVKVGGTFNMSMDYIDTIDGTDYSKQWNVSSNSSNITFNVSEDLGNGMKGVAHLAEYFRLDNLKDTTGANNRMTDGNAYVGLSSDTLGTVMLGSHDTPAKLNGRSVDLFNNQLGDSRNMGVNNTRATNVVAYTSPTFFGVSAMVAGITNTDNGIHDVAGDTEAMAVLVKYSGGPVTVGLARDAYNNNTALGVELDTTNTNATVGVKVGPAKIVAMYQMDENLTVADDERTIMGLGASASFGNHTVKAQWYQATDTTAAGVETEGSLIALGYDFAFSKTFTGYVVVAQSDDDLGGTTYGMAAGGHGDQPAAIAGDTQNGVGIGAIVKF